MLNTLCAFSQQQRFAHLGVNDGLSQSSVYLIYQDKKGFMWFGTGDGLNRYDGNTIKVYRHAYHAKLKGHGDFYGKDAAEDDESNIYFGGRTGLTRYLRKSDRIERFFPGGDTATFSSMQEVLGVIGNTIWFTNCHKLIYSYDVRNKKLSSFPMKDPEGNSSFRLASMDRHGRIWYSLGHGVGCFDTRSARFSFHLTDLFTKYNLKLFQEALLVNDHRLIITAYMMVIDYDPISRKYRELVPYDSNATFMRIESDTQGRLYLGSMNIGLVVFDRKGNRSDFRHNAADQQSLGSDLITKLKFDRSGNLWIGCDGFGVSRTNFLLPRFNLYRKDIAGKFDFKTNFIKCFYEDDKGLWFGTHEGGLHLLNRTSGEVKVIRSDIPGGNTVSCIYPDGNDHLLIGSGAGVALLNRHTLKKQQLTFSPFLHSMDGQNMVLDVLRSRKTGVLYFATREGLYSLKNGSVVRLYPAIGMPFMATLYQTSDHMIWAGCLDYGYVYCFKEKHDGTIGLADTLLIGNSIRSFYEDTVGHILWMASEKGLIRFDMKTRAYRFITTNEGLSNNYLYAVLPGNKDELWLSSNNGLMCYHPSTGKTEAYFESDGLQSNEFNTGCYYRSAGGELFFGGINGFNSFFPSAIRFNPNKPEVVLTKLSIHDEEASWLGNAEQLHSLELLYDQNTLSFEFAALEYTNPLRNKYRYKLEGIDAKWVESGSRHFARYGALKPGIYRLLVKASNNDGLWSDDVELITVIILEPWWQRWWFLSLLLLVALVILYFSIRYFATRKLKQRLRELEKLEAVNKERTRISKDMHDDLGSGLTKIAIMSELLKKQIEYNDKGQVDKISQTAGDLIDNMSHIIWAMNPENDRVENLLSYLREYALDFFDDTAIRCEIYFDEAGNIELAQQARRNLFLVIKESLNNIVKHSGANLVQLEARLTGRLLMIRIRDNGKGFEVNDTRRFGNGLLNMKKRISEVGGIYEIQSQPGKGTIISIELALL